MTKITATFSTGFTDTYNGTRDVRAAWAIIRKADGVVLNSGHSLDAGKALRTAEGNLRYLSLSQFGLADHPLRYVRETGSWARLSRQQLAENKAHNAARLDLLRSLTTIEVVDL
ncbi:MAG TPA: hypothetical protein VFM34_00130 [Moraxellaceae bacterium]|nr:hypothetical protein [Moraxellaceae bacterium]